jgi:O-methyltransferase/methyltransferase family protein
VAERADPKLRGFLLQLVFGYMASQVVHVAVRLGVADLLGEGPKTSDALAEETGTDTSSLHRLLRGLACVGVVEEIEPGRFALTDFGGLLRADHPDSVRNLTLLFCGEGVWENWGHLLDSVKTGRPVFELLDRPQPFEVMGDDPEFSAVFNEAMSEGTRQAAPAVVGAYDFSRFKTIADVGGGDGTLLGAILAATPGLQGILFDLATGSRHAPERLAAAGLADRCAIVEGDFFESVPEGADAYIMKSVIHDWDDERCVTILKSCRRAMAAEGTLLVLEPVLPPKVDGSPETLGAVLVGDLNMLVSTGGRERTEAQFASLFEAAGFRLNTVIPVGAPAYLSVIEGVPA